MYTACPSCHRQFRIYAEHIAAAAGQVRCGFCHEQFSALDRLHDQPLPADKLQEIFIQPTAEYVDLNEEPQFDIPGNSVVEAADETELVVSKESGDVALELERSIAEIGVVNAEEQPADMSKAEHQSASKSPLATEQQAIDEEQQMADARTKESFTFELAESDLEELPEKSSGLMTGFWSVATLLSLVIIAGQLAWFNRDQVMLQYPELRPYVKQFCQKVNCVVIREQNTRKITLLNRDVRLHPGYQDALLVNATMQNELSVRQPYPHVQLTLFDTAGALLGYREFVPADYLDSSIDIDEGMPLEAPVHFVLEVVGSSEEAVSFEFRFL